MEHTDASISWSAAAPFSEEGEALLDSQSAVDLVIALDDNSLTMAGEYAAANNLHGALVYGIGNSTEAVYYLDTGIVGCLVVPDEFNVGYQSLKEAAESLTHYLHKICLLYTSISVFAVTMGAFILAGILYGFGSWLECARMVGSGSAAYGQGWEMDAIAACVVGGVSFTGGIGKISGVVVGVLIFTVLIYSLTILGIDTNLQFVFEGIIIITAVTLDCLKYVQKK